MNEFRQRGKPADWSGAFSIQKYLPGGGDPLRNTHADAQGWLEGMSQSHPANFWFKDKNVATWAYQDPSDNWEDQYGIDASLGVFHSGHSGMGDDGTYSVSMGTEWDGNTDAVSTNMTLGNQRLNYLFWSGCESLRVQSPHTPVRTWAKANQGVRLIFGFESYSDDSPHYGRYFWEEWRTGKAFSSAWLDGSTRVNPGKTASVAARAGSAAEAKKCLEGERSMTWTHSGKGFWHWRWRGPKRLRERTISLPNEWLVVEFEREEPRAERVTDMVRRLGLDLDLVDHPALSDEGPFSFTENGIRISLDTKGALEIELRELAADNSEPLGLDEAIDIANRTVASLARDQSIDVVVDEALVDYEQAGTEEGATDTPYSFATTVRFRQVINGVPTVSPDDGVLSISLDNQGRVTRVRDTTQIVSGLTRPKNDISYQAGVVPRATQDDEIETLLAGVAEGTPRQAGSAVRRESESEEIGYEMGERTGRLVARTEIVFGREPYFKTRLLLVPILE